VNKEIDYDNYGIEVLYREDGYVSKYTYQLIRREQKNALDLFGTHVGPVESSYTYLLPDGTLTDIVVEDENEQTQKSKLFNYDLKKVEGETLDDDVPRVSDLKYWMFKLNNERVDAVANNIVEIDTVIKVKDIFYCLIQYSDETSFLLEINTNGTVKSLIHLNMRTTSIALFEKE
jgi:hypothetical protein